jgi:PGF-pre-PGF domain-containing protein
MRSLIVALALLLLVAVNASALVITVDSPSTGAHYNTTAVSAGLSTDEESLWCGYSLNGTACIDMGNSSSRDWQAVLDGLGEGSQSVAFRCNDTSGSQFTSPAIQFTTDFTPPAVTGVGNGSVQHNRSEITWTTDEQADSRVLYGTGIGEFTLSEYEGSFVNIHDICIEGLENKTKYYYYVVSCDRAGNCNQSGTGNFTTPCLEDWVYGEWGQCIAGYQARTASDRNRCGTTDDRDSIHRVCASEPEEIVELRSHTVSWEAVEPNIPKRMVINEDEINVMEISCTANRLWERTSIRVASLSGRPLGLPDPPGIILQYINITSSGINCSEMSAAVIMFRAGREWITSFGINRSSVTLLRFDGTWKAMNTTLISYNEMNTFYEAEVPGFSVFAIKGDTGTGPALCTPGETICEGDVLKECSDWGESVKTTVCEFGCSNETLSCNQSPSEQPPAGADEPEATACAANQARCEGNKVMLCNTLGTGEMAVETCEYGCYEGRCLKPDTTLLLLFFMGLVFALFLMIMRHRRKGRREQKQAEEEREKKRESRKQATKEKETKKEPEDRQEEEDGEDRITVSHF